MSHKIIIKDINDKGTKVSAKSYKEKTTEKLTTSTRTEYKSTQKTTLFADTQCPELKRTDPTDQIVHWNYLFSCF